MALKAVVDSLDSVEEAFREHYAEKDGVFYLALEDFGKHPGAATLKATLNKVNRDKEALAAKVSELEGKVSGLPEDFDPEEWARLKGGAGGKPDEAIQALKEQHARAIEAVKAKAKADMDALAAQIAERDGYIDRTTRNDELRKALRDVGVDMDQHEDVLLDYLGKQIKVERTEDGARKAIVPTELGDVTVADFVKEWAGGKGKVYLGKASGPDPRGSNRARGGARTMTRSEFERLDPASQHRAISVDKVTLVD